MFIELEDYGKVNRVYLGPINMYIHIGKLYTFEPTDEND